jgi:hypothetical protein
MGLLSQVLVLSREREKNAAKTSIEASFKAASERWELVVPSTSFSALRLSSPGGSIAIGGNGDESGAREFINGGKIQTGNGKAAENLSGKVLPLIQTRRGT